MTVPAARLADADAVAEVLWRLSNHSLVASLFGNEAVSGVTEAPWPHITVSPSGSGDLRGMTGGSIQTGVAVEFTAPLDGSVGPGELWRNAVTVIALICGFADTDQDPDRAVIAHVEPSGYPLEQPLTSGQYRVTQTFLVVAAPPQQ